MTASAALGRSRRAFHLNLRAWAAILAVSVITLPLTAAPASARNRDHVAGWSMWCRYVKTTSDDPIFFPGEHGAAKKHDFYGNTTTEADSTWDSLRAGDTSCPLSDADRSAYWQPEMIIHGKAVTPQSMFLYYWAPKGNDPSEVEPIPSGLKMVGTRFYFTCTGKGVKAPHKAIPFDCRPWPDATLTAYIGFPNCWDGQNLDSEDHMSHMAYPDPKLGCQDPYLHVLPHLTAQAKWPIRNGTGAKFSTGDASTLTAEFFDAWDPAVMQQLIDDCMNNGVFCGSIQNGQNRPPIVNDALIVPSTVYATNDLTAIAVHPHDPDKGQTVSLHYQWQVDDLAVGGDSSTLPHAQFRPGDSITVTITPEDSEGMFGDPVTSDASVVTDDVVCPKPAPPGGQLTGVHGGGFGNDEQVTLHLDKKSGKVLAKVTTDGAGAFPSMRVQLPGSISGGTHHLVGIGATSYVVGSGPFTVEAQGDLTPDQVAAGDMTTFNGGGFVPGETVTVSFPHGDPVSVTADASGVVDADLVTPREPGPRGEVTASGDGSNVSAGFDVVPTLTAPKTGEPGVQLAVSVTGYGAREKVDAIVDGVDSRQHVSTDRFGVGAGNLVLRTTFGRHSLRMTGRTSGVSRLVHLSLPAYVSVTPSSGPVGTAVTVSSNYGWVPGESVNLRWASSPVAQLTADAGGSVGTTFEVPSHDRGEVTVKLTDQVLGVAPETTFTITGMDHQTGNRPPTIKSASIEGGPWTNATFTGLAHHVDDPDGDPVTLHYTWSVNGSTVGDDAPTFSDPSLQAGDVLGLSIRPQDSRGAWGDSVAAPPIVLKWEVVATQGIVGKAVGGVDIYGFEPREDVDIKIDSPTGHTLKTVTVNDAGKSFGIVVPLPWPLPGGVHTLYGVGDSSDIVGQGPVTVLPDAHLSPGQVYAGQTTKLAASGFLPGETVNAAFPGSLGMNQPVDATGSVLIKLTSPEEPWPGGNVTVSAPSGSVLTPYSTLATLVVPVKEGQPGEPIPFSLTGYAASETVEIRFDGQGVTQWFTTNAKGSLSDAFALSTTFGRHRVTFNGVTSQLSRQVKVKLKATMSVQPSKAHPGDGVTVLSPDGWVPGEPMFLLWRGDLVDTFTADGDGGVSEPFTVPLGTKPGRYTLTLLDSQLGLIATTKLTVIG